MTVRRKIEIFSAGCAACDDALKLVQSIACPSCEVIVLDMHDANVALRARSLGARSVPAIAVDGKLVKCCSEAGPNEAMLKRAGIGQEIA